MPSVLYNTHRYTICFVVFRVVLTAVVETGRCEVLKESGGLREHIADLGAGDYFGEMAVLADVSRNATIRATTPLEVLPIPKNDCDLLKSAVPAFGNVFRELAEHRRAAGS